MLEEEKKVSVNVDVLIIGTGSAAQTVAFTCRAAGWSVAVLDSRPFGGTCEQRGCEPKKILASVAELVDGSQRMQRYGISAPALSIDWQDLMQFKHSFTDPVPATMEEAFAKAGISMWHGRGHFINANALQVGDETIVGRFIVIAAGSQHASLGIPGEKYLTTSTQFLDLDTLPRRIVFVGGGYIAFEFAHIAARAGAIVSIIHRGPRPLKKFDADLVAQLTRITQEKGIDVQVQTEVTAIEKRENNLRVHMRKGDQEQTLDADLVVHAAGRVPEIDDLHLDAAGIAREKRGITVNNYLQSTTSPAVYAAGDCVASGDFPLTPVASMQARIVASNLLEGNQHIPNYAGIPSIVFTTPPLARVGLTEDEAHAQGRHFTIKYEDTSTWYTSRRIKLSHSGFKVLIEEGTNHILGAHLLGQHAEEVINLFALAIRMGLHANDLKEMIYSYPTSSSDVNYML
jgi:Pyruvate/2-oxoglutarate dehydrogenase complex, dihydrolipoamide dehydrogenase (E3) component, and related enzymes